MLTPASTPAPNTLSPASLLAITGRNTALDTDSDSVDGGGARTPASTPWGGLRTQWSSPLASPSLRACCRRKRNDRSIVYRATASSSSVAGVFRCSSSLCFACGPQKSLKFAHKLNKALLENERRGGISLFLTLTIQTGDSVESQRKLLSSSYRTFAKEVSRRSKKNGVKDIGISYAYDATFKKEDRIRTHLHIHAILFSSSDTGLSSRELFCIWEDSVKKNSHTGYYVSSSAFYAEKVEAGDAAKVSKYVSKFIKSALELASTQNKKMGLRELVVRASSDEDAFLVYNQFVRSFFGVHYTSIGKFASSLAGVEDEDTSSNEDEEHSSSEVGNEDALEVFVPQTIHSVLCDYGGIDSFLRLMRVYAESKEGRSDFVVAFGDVCSLLENNKDAQYRDMVCSLLDAMRYHLGFHHYPQQEAIRGTIMKKACLHMAEHQNHLAAH